ncbi:LCP family protein [Nocardiopsis algeriensis]|uniref:LCP family protein required for cell wall assembly n=1 Tax=Nocardiopsis algeriensis TaxID=1478215 RepID=A0A841IQD9_9ACTN|nr:LCP family protein [Nocardiopsis algeriensis]MBB6118865.1 LCP family protein required for cell wall assembly [Nocardiopsis algeriensis]
MNDDSGGPQRPGADAFRRERSQPLPPEGRRSPRSGRITVPSRAVRRRRTGVVLMAALSVLVLLASGTSWAFTGWMSGALNRFDVFGGLTEGDRPEATGGLTFLVIGSDSREDESGELGGGASEGRRSDTMMLVRLNHERDRVTVVGIPRDLWVEIPGEGSNKINAAYSFGGPQLAVRTVESVTDVRIDHYVEVDFAGFVDVVDALGGIRVCLPEPIHDPKAKLDMAAGTHEVDGTGALAFARTRATTHGDLDRIDRQQQVLAAMLDRALDTETLSDPAKLTAFLESALSSVTVDDGLDTSALNDLAYQMRDLDLSAVAFTKVPIADMDYRTPHGDVALLWDEPAARELFAAVRADRPVTEPEEDSPEVRPQDLSVRVFNATATSGLGAQLDAALEEAGFGVAAPATNWDGSGVDITQVRYGPEDAEAAEYLSSLVPGSEAVEDATLAGELQIVIGANYTTFDSPGSGTAAPEGESSGAPETSTARDNICG